MAALVPHLPTPAVAVLRRGAMRSRARAMEALPSVFWKRTTGQGEKRELEGAERERGIRLPFLTPIPLFPLHFFHKVPLLALPITCVLTPLPFPPCHSLPLQSWSLCLQSRSCLPLPDPTEPLCQQQHSRQSACCVSPPSARGRDGAAEPPFLLLLRPPCSCQQPLLPLWRCRPLCREPHCPLSQWGQHCLCH